MSYRINARTIKGEHLTFKGVKSYEVIDGFLVFTDAKTQQVKRFATANCEIEEEQS